MHSRNRLPAIEVMTTINKRNSEARRNKANTNIVLILAYMTASN